MDSVPEIDKGGHVAMRYRLEAIQDAGALVVLVKRMELKLDWVRQPNVSAGRRHRALAVKRARCRGHDGRKRGEDLC